MAIVRMKKLNVLAARSQKDDLLRELMRLGCVQLREQDLDGGGEALGDRVTKMSSDAPELRARRAALADGIGLLEHYAPKKTPLLAPKPEMKEEVFLDYSDISAAESAAKEIIRLDEKIRNNATEENKQKLLAEALTPWAGFDLPLDCTGTKTVALALGTVPVKDSADRLSAELSEALPESQIFEVGSDETVRYISVFYLRSGEEAAMQVLREHGFAVPSFGQVKGMASDNIAAVQENIRALRADSEACGKKIAAYGDKRDMLKACYDRLNTETEKAEMSELLLKTENVIAFEGWAAEPREQELVALFEKFDCAYELQDPVEDEYPDVPVKLKNNKFSDGLNMVTNMYSLPQYGTIDANPLMAPFFILFYGIMMADMGYGLVMLIMGLLVTCKKRPKEGFLKYFGELLIEGGIATFLMGILTGGFFGDAPKWVYQLLNPNGSWAGLPALIDPLNDTIMILVGAMALGLVHLNFGIGVSFYMKWRDGHKKEAIWEDGVNWMLLLGIIGTAVMKLLGVGGAAIPVIIGVVLYCYGAGYGTKGVFGKLKAAFSAIYNGATGWFGDILSYARLMALMLAGSVVAQVFNQLGAMPGNIIVFFIISILGNTLNFGLNLLGCYVHDLRLQCLEFFGKFYSDGGKPFRPLAIRSKYYDVVK